MGGAWHPVGAPHPVSVVSGVRVVVFRHSVMSDSFATLWTVSHQAPLSVGFPRQEYWSGLPFPSPGDFLDLGTEPASPA